MDRLAEVEFVKLNEELGLLLGFAIVCTEDGEPHFDLQGDHIPEDAMLKAATDFMQQSRAAKEMHRGDRIGDVVFAFPLTTEVAKSLSIETKRTGLLVGVRPTEEVLEKARKGEYRGFSIGGKRIKDEDA